MWSGQIGIIPLFGKFDTAKNIFILVITAKFSQISVGPINSYAIDDAPLN